MFWQDLPNSVTLFSDRLWVSISSTDIMPNSTCDKIQI